MARPLICVISAVKPGVVMVSPGVSGTWPSRSRTRPAQSVFTIEKITQVNDADHVVETAGPDHTIGWAAVAIASSGLAATVAQPSARCMPTRFGANSPTTSVTNVKISVTRTIATGYHAPT